MSAGASYSLSNQEALDSHINQGSSYQQRISGVQGQLNVPAFPFSMTGASGVTTDFSSLGDTLSGIAGNPLLLIGAGLVVVLLIAKRGA